MTSPGFKNKAGRFDYQREAKVFVKKAKEKYIHAMLHQVE